MWTGTVIRAGLDEPIPPGWRVLQRAKLSIYAIPQQPADRSNETIAVLAPYPFHGVDRVFTHNDFTI